MSERFRNVHEGEVKVITHVTSYSNSIDTMWCPRYPVNSKETDINQRLAKTRARYSSVHDPLQTHMLSSKCLELHERLELGRNRGSYY